MSILYDLAPFFLGIAVVAALWFWLRATATPLDSISDLQARTGKGKPVVMRFFKNT